MNQTNPAPNERTWTAQRVWRSFGRPAALALAIAALAAPIVLAAPHGGRGGGHGRHFMGGGHDLGRVLHRLADRLELTEDQRDQVRQVLEDNRDGLRDAMQTLRQQHQALREAAKADPVDEGAVQLAGDALGDAAADAALLRAQVHQELLGVLTAEQLAELEALKADREMRREERRQRRLERRSGAPAEAVGGESIAPFVG